jgi:outer membrane biosynthesis protein TonB
MAKYRVLQGIDYPPNKRAEIGDVVEDLPATSIKWLLESGAIEDSSKPAKKIEEPTPEPTPEPIVEPVVEAPVEAPVEAVKEEVAFDPDAKDGDGDGFLQDGTIHQRPVEEK